MLTIEKIQSEIEDLPQSDYMQLLSWIHEKDSDKWDRELKKDVTNGKLDFLAKEALDESKKGKLKDL
jgi:hypothetical protein